MRSTLYAIVALVTLDPATQWLTVPVLARTLRADDVELTGDWQHLWRPSWTSTSDGASAASRAVQASSNEQPPWAGRPGQAGSAADDDSSAEGDVERPARTYMKCLGTTTSTRACHLQDVYYDLDSGRFIYYGPAGTRAELFGAAMPAGDPWLRLIRGWDTWKNSKHKRTQFFMDWRGGKAPPAAELVAEFTQPLHLRAAMNTRSLGHFIRDDVLPLIDLPMRFGRDPVDFDWVRWESEMELSEWEEETRVLEHYRGLHNSRPSVTWQQVLDQALQGQPSSVKFIRFEEIIAGQGPVDLMSHVALSLGVNEEKMSQWAHMCEPYPFTAMREIAYRNHGLQVASVPELEPFVLFLDGRQGEKRFLANAEELIPNLKKTFPGVRMENVVISALDLQEQLEYLSKATVVVSNIGSRSFRLVYLPNGATTILVGPPEYEVTIEPTEPDGQPEQYTNPNPFFEIEACWGYIGYVNMLQYHVTSEAEVQRAEKWMEWTSWTAVRNSDIVLDEGKLTALLEVALQSSPHSQPYTGTGALSAFASES